jgi:hypothetical protein
MRLLFENESCARNGNLPQIQTRLLQIIVFTFHRLPRSKPNQTKQLRATATGGNQVPHTYRPILAAARADQAGGVVPHTANGAVVSLESAQHLAAGEVELAQPQVRAALRTYHAEVDRTVSNRNLGESACTNYGIVALQTIEPRYP